MLCEHAPKIFWKRFGNEVKPNAILAIVQEYQSWKDNVGIQVPINEYGNKFKNADVLIRNFIIWILTKEMNQKRFNKNKTFSYFSGCPK